MRLTIERDGQSLFELSGENALAPMDEDERALVFSVLTEALSVLAGVTPQASSFAKGVVKDEYSASIERCALTHSSGNVVLLRERRSSPIQTAEP